MWVLRFGPSECRGTIPWRGFCTHVPDREEPHGSVPVSLVVYYIGRPSLQRNTERVQYSFPVPVLFRQEAQLGQDKTVLFTRHLSLAANYGEKL